MVRRAPLALTSAAALALTLVSPFTASTAVAATETVTLAGSLQSELGCPGDWDPGCQDTHLDRVGQSSTFETVFDVPAGSYEFKIAVNDSWDENYGAGGVKDGANIPLVLEGPASIRFSYDDETHRIGMAPTDLAGAATKADDALAKDSLRAGLTRERFYFLMADRFANGDPSNDDGGLTGGRLETGLDPTDKGFYHGGDLQGVIDHLDYIKDLGTTSIWLTPSFKNRPVQGTGDNVSAGYHGYWITDFTTIDPHLGTNAEMKELISAAHDEGMKVFFDIITNHTADVIDYAEGEYSYRNKTDYPYQDADGTVFDDKDYAGTDTFPELDPETSFPYTPVFNSDADETVKVPSWLNDPTMYHNRGDSTFAGESSEYGDFIGLDDLFTERPEVVDGMGEIYSTWVDLGIDGFRIDTTKHVNMEFWQSFVPTIEDEAGSIGNDDFFMFGEVYDARPEFMSRYTTTGLLPATLDFGFQARAVDFVKGKPTTELRDLYAGDDYYTDADSNAYSLPTFLGNHDMGRIAMMLQGSANGDDDLMEQVTLADDLMYLTRGQPITYYGDEQGFIGLGGDKDAREDMFPTQTEQYATEDVLGAPSGSRDHFDESHPIYRHLAELARLRSDHPALADGAQIHRYASNDAGIYAFSRIDRVTGREYVVAVNNATEPRSATFQTFNATERFQPVYGGGSAVRTGKDARMTLTVPPLSARVLRASSVLDPRSEAPAVYFAQPTAGGVVGDRAEIRAAVPENAFTQVTFAVRPVGTSDWTVLGTDDNAPYRVFHDVSSTAKGTLLEYRAVAKDNSGNVSATSTYAVVGDPAPSGGGGGVGPVQQPDAASVPGDHNSEMGCPGDWQPDCPEAQLALDPKDEIWKGEYTSIPAGPYAYKVAIDNSWDENYGAGAVKDGPNIGYTNPGTVHFYYDHATHWVTSDAQGDIITAPGSYQSELGCPGDWQPDCMRPWLQDPDGDGTYTWSTDRIPAGDYEFKVAHNLGWETNYGAGGEPDGANVAFSVPSDGVVVTISYDLESHQMSATTSRAGANPDLTQEKAYWVEPDLLAWPSGGVPDGTDPRQLRWRLHWSPDGGLTVDAEAVVGGDVADLTYDGQLPDSVTEAHPELDGYLALRLDKKTAKSAAEILRGQVAVAMYDDTGRLLDATGVQTAYVLDSLYAAKATDAAYGVTWDGRTPRLRVWAPTAQRVRLLVWPAGSSPTAPVSDATAVAMKRAADGSWSATGPASWEDARYLLEVTVFVPATGQVQTNRVTDPWSTGLTLDSRRSVMVDLDDDRWEPAVWTRSTAPTLGSNVDQSIYELHVRDFSVSDETVPAGHRGSYLAFADDGAGTRHLTSLAEAGLTTVHLLPTFDIASIPEDPADQESPQCDLASFPPDSEEQQACISPVRDTDAFNWGYDPWHFMTPEGSYASSAAEADGGHRTAEFRTMVGALHRDGLRVVLDQVLNHTAASGQAGKSVFDKVVPGYYHRLDATGDVETSTCCQNLATEHAMGGSSWWTRPCCSPGSTGSTASGSTSWVTTVGTTCSPCATRSTRSRSPGTGSTGPP